MWQGRTLNDSTSGQVDSGQMSTHLQIFSKRGKRNYTHNNRHNTSEPDSRFALIAFSSGHMSTRPHFLDQQETYPEAPHEYFPVG